VEAAVKVVIIGVMAVASKGSEYLENDRNIRINRYFYIFI
jgi:hypothetical protein